MVADASFYLQPSATLVLFVAEAATLHHMERRTPVRCSSHRSSPFHKRGETSNHFCAVCRMTRSVYTLCGFEKNNPVGFCVVCEFCGNHKQRKYKQRNINKEAVYKGTTSTRGTHRATALYSDKAVESLQVAVADKVLSATLSATLQLAEHQLVTKIFGSRLQMADKK